MRVSYEWLKELVAVSATPQEISGKLTMAGLEVEGSEPAEGDTVFEINVTPNRPDCLSIIGIARELAAAFMSPLNVPLHTVTDEQPLSDFAVEISNPGLCNRYTGRLIRGVSVSDSPEWIRKRLEKCGIRCINNIVDITNYVLVEFGHPLHAFDADKIEGRKIRVSAAGSGAAIVTLDGHDRKLPEDALLIWDGAKPVAVAGIMGGLDTEVSNGTKNIFLESAYFDPFSVRRTSKRLGLSSESSYRFERGTDIEFLVKALDRAALMIREFAGGAVSAMIDAYPVQYQPDTVPVKYEKVNGLLGTKLSKEEMIKILRRLGIQAEDEGEMFVVSPPAFRRDIKRDSDVAEEVARIFGYDKIGTTLPRSPLSSGRLNTGSMNIRRLREAMRKSGFTEVINYSFMSASDLDMLSVSKADRRKRSMSINNPLTQDEALLRTTLAPALMRNLKHNLDRGMKEVRLFEISKVFEDVGKSLPLEELRLGGIHYREQVPSLWKEEAAGFYVVKGALEAAFQELNIGDSSFEPSAESFLHKGKSADIIMHGLRDAAVGYIGVLSPDMVERLDLKKQRPEVVLFELNLDALLQYIPEAIHYRPVPKYPPVERDIAIIVDESIPSRRITEMIKEYPTELLEDVAVFDCFKGGSIPSGRKSLAFNIVYRSADRTLREEEVEQLHSSLVGHIIEKTGGELRK